MSIPPSKFKPKPALSFADEAKVWGEAIDHLLQTQKIESKDGRIAVGYKTVRKLSNRDFPTMTAEVRKILEEGYRKAGWIDVSFEIGHGSFFMKLPVAKK